MSVKTVDFPVEPEPTKIQSGHIKAINKDTVHKICSGQVVLSLAIAVKELVENALDAGATLVEVKLKNQGLDSLEVSDNGSGVEPGNLEAMTAKYHTSKIREFVDLQDVETFGFRGEALSSLCALSDMSIITRHQSTDAATKIELSHDGEIVKRLPCARTIGTTVTLSNLFGTLPVRKRDFTRNIKKEFAKMCQILQAYCLVATNVRIICSNQTAKGVKSVIMQTNGSKDVQANISAIFGAKQTAELIALESPASQGEMTKESLLADLQNDAIEGVNITSEDVAQLNENQFQLEGYISSCSHGAGRSSKDRQFFYINSRPCEPKNIAKVINEVYHRYNVSQYPFIYLNVITARSDVDVNLTPDKRQLLINNEKILLLAIKEALLNSFGSIPSTYKIQNSTINSMFSLDNKLDIKAEVNSNNEYENKIDILDLDKVPISSTQRFRDVLSQWKHTGDTKGTAPVVPPKRKCVEEITARTIKIRKINEFLNREMKASAENSNTKQYSYESASDSEGEKDNQVDQTNKFEEKPSNNSLNLEQMQKDSAEYDALTTNTTNSLAEQETQIVSRIVCKMQSPVMLDENLIEHKLKTEVKSPFKLSQESTVTMTTTGTDSDDEMLLPIQSLTQSPVKTIKLDDCDIDCNEYTISYTCAELRTSLAEIALSLKAEENFNNEQPMIPKLDRLRFKSEISPSQNEHAENELQREISKDSFARMEILGQFNLGFIIVKLDADLFIVDQHATDEKYNFEMLQRTTIIQNQKLAVPQTLEMTAVNEMILLDHLEVFEKNGFRFEINENAPATKKVRLVAKPFSKNWEFGRDDIDELIFMLQDAPEGTDCRPSRIRAMFASRACRKSVMIGKALNRFAMKSLITQMGEIEQPWNCPHGRPTMRHLINTRMLLEDESDGSQNIDKEKE